MRPSNTQIDRSIRQGALTHPCPTAGSDNRLRIGLHQSARVGAVVAVTPSSCPRKLKFKSPLAFSPGTNVSRPHTRRLRQRSRYLGLARQHRDLVARVRFGMIGALARSPITPKWSICLRRDHRYVPK